MDLCSLVVTLHTYSRTFEPCDIVGCGYQGTLHVLIASGPGGSFPAGKGTSVST